MTQRRARRKPSADWLAMSPEDRQATRDYRANRGSTKYFRDLKTIDQAAPSIKPDETKK